MIYATCVLVFLYLSPDHPFDTTNNVVAAKEITYPARNAKILAAIDTGRIKYVDFNGNVNSGFLCEDDQWVDLGIHEAIGRQIISKLVSPQNLY